MEVPPQRTSAAIALGLVQRLFPMLGPDSALLVTVDAVEHLAPRRLWLVTPTADCEVVGCWTGKDDEGRSLPENLRPDDTAVPVSEVPLPLPGVDVDTISELATAHGVGGFVRVGDQAEHCTFHADRAGASDGWMGFLAAVAERIRPGFGTVARWRDDRTDRLALLQPGYPPHVFTLRASWPPDEEELHVPIELQFLGRARSGGGGGEGYQSAAPDAGDQQAPGPEGDLPPDGGDSGGEEESREVPF